MDLSALTPTARLIVAAVERAHHSVYGPQSLAGVGALFHPWFAAGEVEAALNAIADRVEPSRRRGYPDVRESLAEWVCERTLPLVTARPPAVSAELRSLLLECLWE